MKKQVYYWAGAIVFVIALVTAFIISANAETKNEVLCKQLRIRPYTEKFFTWNGIVDLNQKGQYQPACI